MYHQLQIAVIYQQLQFTRYTLINSLLCMTFIIFHLHQIINIYKQQTMKIINHMNTRVLRGNPVTGEKTTEASLTSEFTSPGLNTGRGTNPFTIYLWRTKTPLIQFYFARIQLWLGQQPLTIYLKENTDSCFTILLPGTNRKGHQPLQTNCVGPSTTLPPQKDQ